MKVIKPVEITAARLISSTVAEPAAGDPAAWSAGVPYTLGQLATRISLHRVFRRIVAGTTALAPESDAVNWEDYGPTLKWAMFDQEISTQSSVASPFTVVVAPGEVCNSLALIELAGSQAVVTMRDGLAGPVVYTRTIELELSLVADWYAYFFEPYQQRSTVVLTDLPPYPNGHITVAITGSGTVKCGGCIVGTVYTMGATQTGVTAGIRDYSRKVTDEASGIVRLEKRKFAKTLRARLRLPKGSINAIHELLAGLRGSAVVWLGDDDGNLDPLVVFGFYKDFSLDLPLPTISYYSIEIEGMT